MTKKTITTTNCDCCGRDLYEVDHINYWNNRGSARIYFEFSQGCGEGGYTHKTKWDDICVECGDKINHFLVNLQKEMKFHVNSK